MKTVAVLFVRPPVLGKTKTRLAAFVGESQALEIYRILLRKSSDLLCAFSGVSEIHSASTENLDLLSVYFSNFSKSGIYVQRGTDLGERMAHSICEASKRYPNSSVLLFGSDIPRLEASHIKRAAVILETKGAVLGPTEDGGFYLVGFSQEYAQEKSLLKKIFFERSWSHGNVFSETHERLQAAGLSCGLLPVLRDLDNISDLFCEGRRPDSPFHSFVPDVRAVLPVYNEEKNLEFVLRPIFSSHLFQEIICADNGSTDSSRELAERLGAKVTLCRERGYGATCLTALADIRNRGGCDIVLFLDADGSDDPSDIPDLLAPLLKDEADFVLGARLPELAEKGALLLHQRLGNALATFLIRLFFRYCYLDLGPMRAIRWQALEGLQMEDRNFGWTIQMQLRALKARLRIHEIPVHYRKRHKGKSKVSATLRGSLQAGRIIIGSVFRERYTSTSVPKNP